jgi:hypothetical protein
MMTDTPVEKPTTPPPQPATHPKKRKARMPRSRGILAMVAIGIIALAYIFTTLIWYSQSSYWDVWFLDLVDGAISALEWLGPYGVVFIVVLAVWISIMRKLDILQPKGIPRVHWRIKKGPIDQDNYQVRTYRNGIKYDLPMKYTISFAWFLPDICTAQNIVKDPERAVVRLDDENYSGFKETFKDQIIVHLNKMRAEDVSHFQDMQYQDHALKQKEVV